MLNIDLLKGEWTLKISWTMYKKCMSNTLAWSITTAHWLGQQGNYDYIILDWNKHKQHTINRPLHYYTLKINRHHIKSIIPQHEFMQKHITCTKVELQIVPLNKLIHGYWQLLIYITPSWEHEWYLTGAINALLWTK